MDISYQNAVERILVTKEQIDAKVKELAREIEAYYKDSDKKLLLLGILKGSVIFMSDLVKEINLPLEIDFMRVSSYKSGTVSSGNIEIKVGLGDRDLSGYNVIIVEDILDTGNTLYWLLDYLRKNHNCEDIKICTLLDKPDRRVKPVGVDFRGFVIPDEFAIGYGLDYNELYRDLPFVGVLRPSVYMK